MNEVVTNYFFELYKKTATEAIPNTTWDKMICSIVVKKDEQGVIKVNATNIYNRQDAPAILKMSNFNDESLKAFMEKRVLPDGRANLIDDLEKTGISPGDWVERIKYNDGVSYSDDYYVLYKGSNRDANGIKEYYLSAYNNLDAPTSEGWLPKWKISDKKGGHVWIKAPGNMVSWGGEGYAEVIASMVCKDLGFSSYVNYKPCIVVLDGERVLCCESNDFCKQKELVTFGELIGLHTDINEIKDSKREGYEKLLEMFEKHYGYLKNVRSYMEDILFLDFMIQNDDRHFGNIAIMCSDEQGIELAPIFDNGSSLGLLYFKEGDFNKHDLPKVQPFDNWFIEQLKYIRRSRKYITKFTYTYKMLDYFELKLSDKNNVFNVVNPIPMGSIKHVKSMLQTNYQTYKELWESPEEQIGSGE